MMAGKSPRVTICIPTYNRTCYIDQVMACALNQDYDNYEILVADSSSHDEIKNKVETLPADKICYLRIPSGTPQPAKFNKFLEQAKGEWVVVLCDDDLLDKHYLSKMTKHIDDYPAAALIRCRFQIIDRYGKILRTDNLCKKVMGPREFVSKLFLPEKEFFKMNISGILFRRRMMIEEGGFVELPTAWHVDQIAWAVLGAKGDCIFEEAPLCSIRLHAASITSGFEKNMEASIKTNFLAKEIFDRLIESLAATSQTSEDEEYVNSARKNMNAYMKRHLSRSLDQGFIAALDQPEVHSTAHLDVLFNRMKELSVPNFSSTYIYRSLGILPYPVRKPFLTAFKDFKLRKWCT